MLEYLIFHEYFHNAWKLKLKWIYCCDVRFVFSVKREFSNGTTNIFEISWIEDFFIKTEYYCIWSYTGNVYKSNKHDCRSACYPSVLCTFFQHRKMKETSRDKMVRLVISAFQKIHYWLLYFPPLCYILSHRKWWFIITTALDITAPVS